MSVRSSLWICALWFVSCVAVLMGQTAGTGALAGAVTDPQGAAIAGATVTITSSSTNQTRTGQTGTDGGFRFNLLQPGDYSVKFEARGFQTANVSGVTVNVGDTPVLNRQLQVGQQTEVVTVESTAEAVQTASSTVGSVIASRTVTDLPLSTRNYVNLLSLSAGANSDIGNAAQGGKGSISISTNGASSSSNNYQMDGVSISSFSGISNLQEAVGSTRGGIAIPNPDSIQEFQVQTSTYDASFGRNVGASVNVVTKSGTNAFHGAAWEYLRDTIFNANDYFFKQTQISRGFPNKQGVLNQSQFGGALGGPVKKDKLFFYTNYQGTRSKNGANSTGQTASISNAPLPVMGTSGFNSAGSRGSCPLSATTIVQCDATAQAFATALAAAPSQGGYGGKPGALPGSGSIVLGSNANMNPVALRILQLAAPNPGQTGGAYLIPGVGIASSPNPNGATGPAPLNTAFSIPSIYNEDQLMANVDYIASTKHTLSLRYFYSKSPTDAFLSAQGGSAIPGFGARSEYTYHTGTFKLTSLLSNTLVNQFRGSLQYIGNEQTNSQTYSNKQVGITPPSPQVVDSLMGMVISGMFTGTHPFSIASNDINQNQFGDQISWSHGKHTIRAGVDYSFVRWPWTFTGLQVGNLGFNSFTDFLIGQSGNFASTGIGIVSNSVGSNITNNYRSFDLDSFVQDDYKVSQRLTVNLGLRWEYFAPIKEADGRRMNIWPSLVNGFTAASYPVVSPANVNTSGCLSTSLTACPGSTLAGFVAPANFNASTQSPTGNIPTGVSQAGNDYAVSGMPTKAAFSPRIGFAWQPTGSNRLVVRGAGGIFYDRKAGEYYVRSALQATPYFVAVGRVFPIVPPQVSFANPYLGTTDATWTPRWVCPTCNGTSQPLSSNRTQALLQEATPTPTTYQWNLNVQYEFLPRWVAEVGYVGTKGIHQGVIQGQPSNPASLADPTNPVNCGLGTCITNNSTANVALRVPLLGFTANNPGYDGNDVNYKFTSFQATVRKQFSKGLSLQGAYTYSDAQVSSWVGVNQTFPIASMYGPNPAYHPNRFALNYSYDLPFGKHKGVLGKVAEGWNLSGVTVIQDGTPLTITDSRAGTIYGGIGTAMAQFGSGMTADNVATSGSIQQRLGAYYNTAAFVAPMGAAGSPAGNSGSVCTAAGLSAASCTSGTGYGNSGLGILKGPPQKNWDVNISKTTVVGGLRENATLQFRAEFYNAFNHPQFGNPAGSNLNSGGTFGRIASTIVNPRLIQFALKYSF